MSPDHADPRSIWLDGDGIRVHGLDFGPAGAPGLVILLHGVGGNARIWEPAATRLRASLGGRARVLALDGRDGGLTDHPPSGYEPERFAADLVAIHDALGAGPLVIVGHSRGGWLAAWFAERFPERVNRLVLVDPARLAFASEADADRFYDWVRGGLGPFVDREDALAWARRRDPEADWNEARTRSFLAGLVEGADGLRGRLPVHAVAALRQARERTDSVGPRLGDIACPTLLLVAERQSPELRRDKLAYADGLRDVRAVPIDGSHFLHTDAPARVVDEIVGFLGAGWPQAGG